MTTISLEKIAIDNGDNSVNVTGESLDNRSQMLASAARIVATVISTEGTLAETAKQHGHFIFAAVYNDGLNLDALIGDSKVAAGWNSLSQSDAGRKAKGRMEVYFSNYRLVAERWSSLTDEQKADVLAGLSSVHYLAGQFRKADKEAKSAADKEAKRVKAEADAAEAKALAGDAANDVSVPEAGEVLPLTLVQLVEATYDRYMTASEADKVAAHAAMEALFEAVNADILANIGEAEVEEAFTPEAIAA